MDLTHFNFAEALIWYVLFLFSTTFHEAGHAWVAKLGGDLTAYHGGQVSLNPEAHIRREPLGMVVLPIVSLFLIGWPFGYASAPYDPVWAQRHHKKAAYMSLAGPVSNLILVLAAAGLIRLGMSLQYFSAPEAVNFTKVAVGEGFAGNLALMLSILFSLNLILGLFNLVPLPPLDGSGALPLFMSRPLALRYQKVIHSPVFAMMGLLVAWKIFDPIFSPVFLFAINLLYPEFRYG